MATIIIPLLIFTLNALSVSYWLHKPFYSALAFTIFSTILILYIGYILNLLPFGRLLIITACSMFSIITIFQMLIKRKIKSFLKEHVITPPMFIYVSLAILFIFLSRGKQVGLWDSLRLWGAYPKALYAYGTLQLGADSILFTIMQSYPPGMPLLGYFFTRVC
jgi:hypothetical protein